MKIASPSSKFSISHVYARIDFFVGAVAGYAAAHQAITATTVIHAGRTRPRRRS
jgi:hypothetical protein